MQPIVDDELYAKLVKEALAETHCGLLVMNEVIFRVAILNAYKKGYADGWTGVR